MSEVYKLAKEFKRKYPFTIAWRLRKNSSVIDKHLNPGEKVKYVMTAQKNDSIFDIFSTCIFVITNKRILIGRKRVVFGYFLDSITPDLFNDMKVSSGLLWGKVYIDTVKENVVLSNIDKGALEEIETKISTYLTREKKKYGEKPETAQ